MTPERMTTEASPSRNCSSRLEATSGAKRERLPPGLHLHADRAAVDGVRIRRRSDAAAERVRPVRPGHERAQRRTAEKFEGRRDLRSQRQLDQRAARLVALHGVVVAGLGCQREEPPELTHRADLSLIHISEPTRLLSISY